MPWKNLGGGSIFRTIRADGRKAEVVYDTTGKWIALVEKVASRHAGMGETERLGAFDSRAKAMRAATMKREV